MTTLKELGLERVGNFLRGNRKNIVLNNIGASYLNELFPRIEGKFFDTGDQIVIKGRLPKQESNVLTAVLTTINLKCSVLVSVVDDNWFERKNEK